MVESPREPIELACNRRILASKRHGSTGRFRIQAARIVHQRGRHTDARRKRKALSKPMIQAVDRLHMNPRRIVLEAPAELAAAGERGMRMAMQGRVMRLRAIRQRPGRPS